MYYRRSISRRVIPKTQKMVLDASLLNTQHYKVRIKAKQNNSGKGVAPSHTPRCSCYYLSSMRRFGTRLNIYTYIYSLISLFNGISSLGSYIFPGH